MCIRGLKATLMNKYQLLSDNEEIENKGNNDMQSGNLGEGSIKENKKL